MSVEDYFAELRERWQRSEAKCVRYEHWSDAQLSRCHVNVAAYVCARPDCKAVRGAWMQPIAGADGGYFIAHSLVEVPGGEWLDITPLTEQERDSGVEDPKQRANLVFLEHHGTDEQFQQFCKIARVAWPPTIPSAMDPDFGSGEGLM